MKFADYNFVYRTIVLPEVTPYKTESTDAVIAILQKHQAKIYSLDYKQGSDLMIRFVIRFKCLARNWGALEESLKYAQLPTHCTGSTIAIEIFR